MIIEDENVLLDLAIFTRLNGDDHKQAELQLEHLFFAGFAKLGDAEVLEKLVDSARADRYAHETRGQIIALEVALENAMEAELEARAHIKLCTVEHRPVWLVNLSVIHQPLMCLFVLLGPFL